MGIFVNRYGDKAWYIDRKYHRLDGPAIEWNSGSKEWFSYNKRHRIDGPAVESYDGTKEWWVDGERITELEHKLLSDMMKLKGLL